MMTPPPDRPSADTTAAADEQNVKLLKATLSAPAHPIHPPEKAAAHKRARSSSSYQEVMGKNKSKIVGSTTILPSSLSSAKSYRSLKSVPDFKTRGATSSSSINKEDILPLEEHLLRRFSSKIVPVNVHLKTQCGIGPYRPKCLQRFATPGWMLFWMCWFCLMQGIIVSGLGPSTMTSIERRYNFPDSVLGNIMQSYEIGYVLTCVPVSYFGGRHSKPLYLGVGLFFLASGSFLYSMPHILSGWYLQKQESSIGHCANGNRSLTSGPAASAITMTLFPAGLSTFEASSLVCKESEESVTGRIERYRFMLLFCFAQFLNGVGSTPLMTLGVSYIDENVKPTQSPFYIGIFYACLIFGPAIGFTLTGIFNALDVNFLSLTPDALTPVSRLDANRVGAWWVGFQIISIFSLFAVFPILSFPRLLPSAEKYQKCRMDELRRQRKDVSSFTQSQTTGGLAASGSKSSSTAAAAAGSAVAGFKTVPVGPEKLAIRSSSSSSSSKEGAFWIRIKSDLRHIPNAVRRIVTNASYMCITMSATVEGILIGGLIGFMPKYLERQFNIDTSRTNYLIGFIMVPFAGVGVLLSGYVVKRFGFTCTKTIKYCIFMSLMTALLSPMFLVYCRPTKLVGVEVGYDDENASADFKADGSLHLLAKCNAHCVCDEFSYQPVCARSPTNKSTIYFSSCFAGCPQTSDLFRESYTNCTCPGPKSEVKSGLCHVDCSALVIFLALFAPTVFCTFSIGVPALSVVLRCVDYDERSFALAIQWIVIRCLGMIPAPIIFSKLFEWSCLVSRKKPCEQSVGFCYMYDNVLLARLFLMAVLVGQTISCLFLVLALIFFQRSGLRDVGYDDKLDNQADLPPLPPPKRLSSGDGGCGGGGKSDQESQKSAT